MLLNMVPGLGPVLLDRLSSHWPDPREMVRVGPRAWSTVEGIGPAIIRGLETIAHTEAVEQEHQLMRQHGVQLVTRDDREYPQALRDIVAPPPVLYCRGSVEPLDAPRVAIVGTRAATANGTIMARQLAEGLAGRGVKVVSGLARGIDAAAHRAAITVGRTEAVVGHGLSLCYPAEHRALADEITQRGCVWSEFPMTATPQRGHFPRRNRIISGLSLGVIVVEAGQRSGALSTAQWALDQGREVMAVPGPASSPWSIGAHRLIRDGAALVTTVDEVLETLQLDGIQRLRRSSRVAWSRSDQQETDPILQALEESPHSIDELAELLERPAGTLSQQLLRLELDGHVQQQPGARFSRVSVASVV